MKKYISLLVIISSILSLYSCGTNNQRNDLELNNNTDITSAVQSSETTTINTMFTTVELKDLKNTRIYDIYINSEMR